jgi:Lon protease-like protein
VDDPLPMFPLGTVLFPHSVLPLHVFEPRYRTLTERCLAGDSTFGVVLIERGSEVGGGEVRFDVGTVTRILQAGRLDDGRWVLVTVGERRVRVRRWLPDDPYPLAEVEPLTDPPVDGGGDAIAEIGRQLRRVLALRAELGDTAAGVDVRLDADPVRASFEACGLAALGPLDAQALLELDDTAQRLAQLDTMLRDEATLLELRLSSS